MSDNQDLPQVYLITPSEIELSTFPQTLAACLDSVAVACVRLALGTRDEDRIAKSADALREITHARDVALVIETHVQMVERLGLDGVHLTDGAKSVMKVRKDLGEDAIVGAYCRQSRHDGMTAGELSADYVAFGPVGQSTLDDGNRVEFELFEWWSQMIEVPVVAEGALDHDILRQLAAHTDFFGIGDEIWKTDNPVLALQDCIKAMA
ncbi:thiamine-phosphate pyrophosphorylase [Cognatiyoonia koreensis]|uniref:Thiamine-phosphate pyrophosphorylase n=1 Tax=Cognatiyoonia koreensis TaxID=364200 RepID=A0A1I0PAA2_9RHOB|nr:thiamine phosphate synthase [Cognatiyoonia koreensis]SEW11216.1 thiamine-phosphate pyrophosphorylase [Cognatiyoonia koreensis]